MSSKNNHIKQFWNDECDIISSHLLSHIQINSADDICNNDKSWFLQNHKFSFNDYKEINLYKENVSIKPIIRDRKIRIYPTQQQKTLFKRWFGISRKFYNETLSIYKEGSDKKWHNVYQDIAEKFKDLDYVKSIPYHIKKVAVRDYDRALYINKVKSKRLGKSFDMKYRSKKDTKQSCFIPKSAIKSSGIYYTIAGKLKMKEKEWFISSDNKIFDNVCDCRLVLEHGKWFIIIPKKIETKNIDNQDGIVAIDPGIRTFATYFSTDGSFGKLGKNAFERILNLNFKIDKLISQISKEKDKKKKSNLKRSIYNTRFRIKNLIDELHWKVIKFFTNRFKVIIFPPFNVSEMVKKSKRRLFKKVVRSMNCLRFYDFKERLKMKCNEYGLTFIESSEAYTSKTNSFTGKLIENLGSKENFVYDNILIDRDINGARNILIRAMRDASV
jgi:similar to tr